MFSFFLSQFVALSITLALPPCVPVFVGPVGSSMPAWKWEVAGTIGEVWKGTGDEEIAKAVAYSEHGFNCDGVSPTNDHGLFQLNGIPEYNCRKNAEIAFKNFYLHRGFQPWTDYRNGNYKRYLSCS